MNLDHILQALRHFHKRQDQFGPTSAFRFALFIGPDRKRMSAKYPVTDDHVEIQEEPRRRKDKGKKKKPTDQLDNLLTISQTAPTLPNPSEEPNSPDRDPSRVQDTVGRVQELDMVRIDLGQASRLSQMGYQLHGPGNGPNEGWPEYEVPRALFDKLNSQATASINPTPTPSGSRPYPRPRPIHKPSQLQISNAIPEENIDPSLLHPDTNPDPDPDPDPLTILNPIVPSLLGKQNLTIKSPPNRPTTRSTRRKVITADDRAMQEAQELMTRGTRTRSRVTRKSG